MRMLDQAQVAFNRETKILKAEAVLSPNVTKTPYYAFYTTPSDLFLLEGVESVGLPIDYTTETMMRRRYVDWRNESGIPRWFLFGRAGADIRMVPYSTDVLTPTLAYIRKPGLIAVTDIPDIPEAYHAALPEWAIWRLLTQNDEYRDPTKAGIAYGEYNRILGEALNETASHMVKTPRRINRRMW